MGAFLIAVFGMLHWFGILPVTHFYLLILGVAAGIIVVFWGGIAIFFAHSLYP
jgi:hypothetical protein